MHVNLNNLITARACKGSVYFTSRGKSTAGVKSIMKCDFATQITQKVVCWSKLAKSLQEMNEWHSKIMKN